LLWMGIMRRELRTYGVSTTSMPNHRDHRFRGKLLTLLSLVSGAGIYALILKQGNPHDLDPAYPVAIAAWIIYPSVGLAWLFVAILGLR
jgi:hypothetical protein